MFRSSRKCTTFVVYDVKSQSAGEKHQPLYSGFGYLIVAIKGMRVGIKAVNHWPRDSSSYFHKER